MYILLLLAAAVVLAFVLESVAFFRDAMRTPISAAADERWWPKRDRRVFPRLAAASGAVAFVLVAGVIAADLADPSWGFTSAGRNLTHPYALLLYGAALCLVALLCGVKPSQPVLLLSLTLPQLVVLPLALLAGGSMHSNILLAILVIPIAVLIQPASWILLPIGIGQSRLLNKPGSNFTFGGFVRLFLILVAYLFGTIH